MSFNKQFWFLEQISKRSILPVENTKKMNITIESFILELVWSTNFQLKLTIAIFWTKFAQEKYLWSKTEKVNIIIEFRLFKLVSWYQISALTDNFDFFDQICPKKVFLVKNRKSEHHHWILLIQISLGTKFQLKLTISIFCTKFAQKGISSRKQKKSEHHHGILHIWISLGTKFQLKLIILSFWTKFFQLKTEQVVKDYKRLPFV